MSRLGKKILIGVPVAVILLVVVALAVLFFKLNGVVKTAVETVLPKMTKTRVTLDKVDISLFSGKATLSGFVMGNPEGFQTESALTFATVRVEVDLWSLLTDKIVIRDIYIDSPRVTYEAGILAKSNFATIQKNVEDFAGPPSEKKPGEEKKPGKKIQIDHFLMENGKVSVSAKLLQGQSLTVPLPRIELRDIGKESGGASPVEVVSEVFGKVAGSVEEVAKGALARAKELVGKGAEAVGEAGKGVIKGGKEAVGGAVEGIKGLFNKKKDE